MHLMAKKSKSKYYVVWVGQNPGVYDNWTDTQAQIKGFPNARYKSFKTKDEALLAFRSSAQEFISNNKKTTTKPNTDINQFKDEIINNSISVDAACSGNPGVMEYRAVDTFTNEEIFRMGPFKGGTNNIGEFLALVHALALLDKQNDFKKTIYTDSRTALSWIKNRKVKTTLKSSNSNKPIFELLSRAENWIKKNEIKNPILKWDTKRWGEIPADFGRK